MTTVEILIQNMYTQLSKTERLAADYLTANIDHVFKYPLAVLAERSGTSQGAWVRLCKAIGYEGLKDLKTSLFNEIQSTAIEGTSSAEYQFIDIKNHENLTSIANNVCACSICAIEDTLKLFDEKNLETAVKKIKGASRIAIFGLNASNIVASDLYSKLLRVRYPALYCEDYHVSLTIASTLTPNDVAIFFSYSGETADTIKILNLAKQQGAFIISVTRPAGNIASSNSDITLFVNSPQTDKRSGAMSSRIAQMVMSDILFTAIINQDYDRTECYLENTYRACRGDHTLEQN